jgi:hypothetical protein
MLRKVPVLTCLVSLGGLAPMALAYPGGTPSYVTDVAPFCTGCHSSTSPDQLQGVPARRVQAEQAANKHLASIRAAKEGSPYASLTDEQREALIRGIEQIDAASRIEILAPATLKAGQVFEVTLNSTGGAGPVVGLALVDANQRWQARPAASAGWRVLEKPRVTGPDGQPQTRFTDGRNAALAPGTSYVNVYGVSTDPGLGRFSSVSATFRLRAPEAPGEYPLAGVLLYGTEKAAPHGAVESLQGKRPLGGFAGNSGRVKFTPVLRIRVE